MKMLPPPKAVVLLVIMCFYPLFSLLAGPMEFLRTGEGNPEKPRLDRTATEQNRREASLREDDGDATVDTSANMARASGTATIAEQPQKGKTVDSAEMNPRLFSLEELHVRVLKMQGDILKWQEARDRFIDSDIQEKVELLNKAKIDMGAYKKLQNAYASFIEKTYFMEPEVREKLTVLMTSFERVLSEIETTTSLFSSTELDDSLEAVPNIEEVNSVIHDFLKLKGECIAGSSIDRSHLPREVFNFSRIQERINQTVRSAQNSRLNSRSANRNSLQNLEPVRATQVQQPVIAIPYIPPVVAIEMNETLQRQRQNTTGRVSEMLRNINWAETVRFAMQNMFSPFGSFAIK